jgi:hypothetical protein
VTKPLPATAQRKIDRLERENELLREKISHHMRVYGETLGELVTLKTRLEQAANVLKGLDE